jgi:uncharacterized protein (TIGR02271 family)
MKTYMNEIETGTSVYGSDGEKLGDVAGVTENYFVVEKGFFFPTDVYVPMSAIRTVDEDGIQLTMTKDEAESSDWSAPPAEDDGDYSATDTGFAERDIDVEGQRIERREERLTVDKQAQQAGSVQVGKRVVEERQAVDVPVTREEVTIERHAVDRPTSGEAFTEDSIEVPVYEERVETDKEARVVEELEIGKTAVTDTARVEDTVRREEFEIDETGTTRNRDRGNG